MNDVREGIPPERNGNPLRHDWTYRDPNGRPLAIVARYDKPEGGKNVLPFKPNGSAWRPGALPEPRPLFGLEVLAKAKHSCPVLIVEGEKCASALHSLGMVAVTWQGGSSAVHKADWTALEDYEKAYILPDTGHAGIKAAKAVAGVVGAIPPLTEVHLVELPGLPPDNADVCDWLAERLPDWDQFSPVPNAERMRRELWAAIKAAARPMPDDWPKDPAKETATELSILRADEIKPEPIQWLWAGWLARGKVHVLAGAPGTGKTSVAIDLAATLSVGGCWPDGTQPEVGHVLIWSGEDDPRDTLVPRLIACGADRSKVSFVSSVIGTDGSRPFDPANDADLLRQHAARMNPPPALLIVDPIVSAVAGDSHKNAEVRRSLQPLVDLAQSLKCAVLGISHFTKGTAGRDPTERVTGSLAFGALARVVLAAAKLSDEQGGARLFARAKNNLGLDHGGFRYDLDPLELSDHPGVFTTRVLWGEALEGTARDLLGMAETTMDPEEHSARADAKAFLLDLLAEKPVPSKTVKTEAGAAGHAWSTIRRAQKAIGVDIRKVGGHYGVGKQQWMWALPSKPIEVIGTVEHAQQGAEGATQKNMSTFSKNEHLQSREAEGAQDAHAQGVGAFNKDVSTFRKDEHLQGEMGQHPGDDAPL